MTDIGQVDMIEITRRYGEEEVARMIERNNRKIIK